MNKAEIKVRPESLKTLVTENAIFRSMYDFQLTQNDLELALEDLGETEEMRNASLKKFKKMLLEHKSVQYRADDAYLLRYLRCKKFDCDRAFNMIKKGYDLRSSHAEIFALPSNFEFLMNMGVINCLPYRDEAGSIIIWINMNNWNLDDMSLLNVEQVCNCFYDIISMNPSCQVNSIMCFYDVGGLTVRHITQCLNPSKMVTLIQRLQVSHPFRIKRMVAYNVNSLLRSFYHLVIPWVSKKMADRIILLGSDISEVHRYINPTLLPKCYGGNVDENECRVTDLISDNLKYLEYENSFSLKREGK